MIYLIGKIFLYLLVALGLGAAAGWLWRNLQAAQREAELERALMDSRGRLPQLDTTLRAREERLENALAEIKRRDQSLTEQQQQLAERDRAVTELERACAELRQRLERSAPASGPAAGDDALELHSGEPDTSSAPVVPAAPPATAIGLDAGAAPAADAALNAALIVAESERDALQVELAAVRTALDRATAAVAVEQRRVTELTRERDLQHRALKALEQQLDLARDDDRQHRAANG